MSTTPQTFPPGYLEEYCGDDFLRVGIAVIPIEIIFVALRYYARYLSKTPWRLDDFLILPSLITNMAVVGCCIAMVKYAGVGYHIAAVAMQDPAKVILWAKFIVAVPILYVLAVTLPKLAVLSLYMNIFTQKSYRIACYVIGAILLTSAFANIVAGIVQCIPMAYLWDKTIKGGHCIDTNAYFRWASLPNILTDIGMLILPHGVVWNLQTTKAVKVGLTLTFLTGSIGMVMSIIRFVGFLRTNATEDGTWSSVNLLIWTCLEICIYTIAACLPTFRPFAVFFIKRTGLTTNHSKDRTGKHGNLNSDNSEPTDADSYLAHSKGFASRTSPLDLERNDYTRDQRLLDRDLILASEGYPTRPSPPLDDRSIYVKQEYSIVSARHIR